jgi:hypothetical protein
MLEEPALGVPAWRTIVPITRPRNHGEHVRAPACSSSQRSVTGLLVGLSLGLSAAEISAGGEFHLHVHLTMAVRSPPDGMDENDATYAR